MTRKCEEKTGDEQMDKKWFAFCNRLWFAQSIEQIITCYKMQIIWKQEILKKTKTKTPKKQKQIILIKKKV